MSLVSYINVDLYVLGTIRYTESNMLDIYQNADKH